MNAKDIEQGFKLLGIDPDQYEQDIDSERVGSELVFKSMQILQPVYGSNTSRILPSWGFYA